MMINKCLRCGKEFKPLMKTQKYCSFECGYRSNYERQKNKIVERNRKYRTENREKYNLSRKIKYYSPEWQEKRKSREFAKKYLKWELLEKFKFKCANCSSKNKLEIHHKRYSDDINDLILLCKECHGKEHRLIM